MACGGCRTESSLNYWESCDSYSRCCYHRYRAIDVSRALVQYEDIRCWSSLQSVDTQGPQLEAGLALQLPQRPRHLSDMQQNWPLVCFSISQALTNL